MRFKRGAIGQIHRLGGNIVHRGLAVIGRRAAHHRVLASRIDDAAGDAGVGGHVSQQPARGRLLAPQLFDHALLLAGSNRHHGRLGALRHVTNGRSGGLRGLVLHSLGFGLLRGRGWNVQGKLGRGCGNLRLRCLGSLRRLNGLRHFGRWRGFCQLRRFGRSGRTDLGSSPCGADAANRSLNISELATFSGAGITSGRCSSDANISLKAGCTGRAAAVAGFLTTGASKAALFTVG